MKTVLTATVFALTLGRSGLTHAAGFADRSAIPETAPTPSARQDLRHLPQTHGFQQQSVHALAAPSVRSARGSLARELSARPPPPAEGAGRTLRVSNPARLLSSGENAGSSVPAGTRSSAAGSR